MAKQTSAAFGLGNGLALPATARAKSTTNEGNILKFMMKVLLLMLGEQAGNLDQMNQALH